MEEAGFINPVDGLVTDTYRQRNNPVLGTEEDHEGIDIAVPENTEVKAVADGVVTAVGVSDTYGNYIKYETYNNYTVLYAHLNEITIYEGDEIKQGDTIALSGNTGLSTGPHLHYGLWYDDVMIDPIEYVELPYSDEVTLQLNSDTQKE